jgi:hypothetical protein
MRKQKKKRLAAKGWKVSTVKEFLGLSDEESAYIELKTRLCGGSAAENAYPSSTLRQSFSRVNRASPKSSGRPFGFVGPTGSLFYRCRRVGVRAI